MSQLDQVDSPNERALARREGASMWTIIAIVVVGLPLVLFLSVWLLIAVTNNLDLVYALGVPEAVVHSSLLAATGALVGLAGAAAAALKRWRLLAPPVAGIVAGLGIYLLMVELGPGRGFDSGATTILITTLVGQALAIILATRYGDTSQP